jgi:hypothetical protein
LNTRLQTALGNAQTIVAFRISRADAEPLARVLGEVDTQAIKHESQTDVQHPVFSPLSDQWEEFVQFLTKQNVRQATVKTADDRLAVIWAERVRDGFCSDAQLEQVILNSLKNHGQPFDKVFRELVSQKEKPVDVSLFSR